jgi:hypothetical protein
MVAGHAQLLAGQCGVVFATTAVSSNRFHVKSYLAATYQLDSYKVAASWRLYETQQLDGC